ncbi:MAG TPA: hypothetical protein VLS90_17810 [Thermodesulfobacteriota bacterium]|nr:hypothetical protein [Thermodesulfobacteriota bacterium]
MASPRKTNSRRDDPSQKSLEELAELLLKLNSKLREKIPASRKNADPASSEVIIIIMRGASKPAPAKPAAPKAPKHTWMDDLFSEIEDAS